MHLMIQNVTMVITMGPLTEDMLRRPRYWSRTISVLCRTVTSEDVPATVLQVTMATGWLREGGGGESLLWSWLLKEGWVWKERGEGRERERDTKRRGEGI